MFTKKTNGSSDLLPGNNNGDVNRVRTWRLVDDLTLRVFEMANSLPHGERDCLSRQIRETAALCGAAVAEWAGGKKGREEYSTLKRSHSLMISLRYYIYLARRLNLIEQKQYAGLIQKHEAASSIIEAVISRCEDEKNVPGGEGARPL